MRRPHRPAAVAHETRQRVLGFTSLVVVLGLYAAVLIAPFLGPVLADVGPGEALRATVFGVTLTLGALGVALFR